jgi:hypothetical protein
LNPSFFVDDSLILLDAKFSKQYLEGKYGGVYDMTSVINWDEIDAGMKTF